MITIQELLYNRGLDKNAKIKLVRHKDKNNPDLYDMYKTKKEWFFAYQSSQSDPVFKGTDYIVSFIGEVGVASRFIGVFEVCGVTERPNPDPKDPVGARYDYKMHEVGGFDDLKERVIIKWGNPISWHQWIENKMEVIEIHPGLHYKQFTDYSEVLLTFDELKDIVTKQYSDWKKMLSAVKGIYLITDTKNGKQYVGSAYREEDGIWGRWSVYANTKGHGGNKTLRELVEKDPAYGSNFQFSILALLSKTVTPDEAIKKECLYKKKLRTIEFGYNNN